MRNFNVSLRETPQNSAQYRIMRGAEFHREILRRRILCDMEFRVQILYGTEFYGAKFHAAWNLWNLRRRKIKRLRICSVSR
nr:hypothetical protein [uncultured Campylobacter sp.]